MPKEKETSSVVKIDSELLSEVEKLIEKDEHKFRFVNKKQFIDLAVQEYLKGWNDGKKT